jgi:hypothetical protein
VSDLDRTQALLLLNEHVGQQVHAAVELDIGFGYEAVTSACGVLAEMRPPEGKQPATPTLPGDGPTGLYRVGDVTVSVPEQGFLRITSSLSGSGIHVRLADNVGLNINWAAGPPRQRSPRRP